MFSPLQSLLFSIQSLANSNVNAISQLLCALCKFINLQVSFNAAFSTILIDVAANLQKIKHQESKFSITYHIILIRSDLTAPHP